MWLRNPFKRKEQPPVAPVLTSREEAAKIKDIVESIKAPAVEAPLTPPRQSRGRVVKELKHPEYNPHASRRGGRIVKTMPRQLQKIKQAQEKVEDDGDQPKIEELPD